MRTTIQIAVLASSVCAGAFSSWPRPASPASPLRRRSIRRHNAWQTCKTVGEGTICEGTVSFSYGPIDTGLTCGSGASAFDIFDSATESELARRFYDENGDLMRACASPTVGRPLNSAIR